MKARIVKVYVGGTKYVYVANVIKAIDVAKNSSRNFYTVFQEQFDFCHNILAMARVADHIVLYEMAKRLNHTIGKDGVISGNFSPCVLYEYPSRTNLIELGYSYEVEDLT